MSKTGICGHLTTTEHYNIYRVCSSCREFLQKQNIDSKTKEQKYDSLSYTPSLLEQKQAELDHIKNEGLRRYQEEVQNREREIRELLISKELEQKREEELERKMRRQNEERLLKEREEALLKQKRAEEERLRIEKQRIESERKLELERQEALKRQKQSEEDNFRLYLNTINSSINNNNQRLNSSCSNADFSRFGFKNTENYNGSRLGDLLDRIQTVPNNILTQHKNKVSSCDNYDNLYEVYTSGNNKYIIGCERCLQFWDHKCYVKVFIQ